MNFFNVFIWTQISLFNGLKAASHPYLQARKTTNVGALFGEYDQSFHLMTISDLYATQRQGNIFEAYLYIIYSHPFLFDSFYFTSINVKKFDFIRFL